MSSHNNNNKTSNNENSSNGRRASSDDSRSTSSVAVAPEEGTATTTTTAAAAASVTQKSTRGKTNNDKQKMRQTLDTLSREMAVAEYSKSKNGQYRKVTPKELSLQKTRKRKALEREDYEMLLAAEHELVQDLNLMGGGGGGGDEADTTATTSSTKIKRLRGSRVSLEESVVEGSLPLLAAAAVVRVPKPNHNNDQNDNDNAEQDDQDEQEEEQDEEEEIQEELEELENRLDEEEDDEGEVEGGEEEGDDDEELENGEQQGDGEGDGNEQEAETQPQQSETAPAVAAASTTKNQTASTATTSSKTNTNDNQQPPRHSKIKSKTNIKINPQPTTTTKQKSTTKKNKKQKSLRQSVNFSVQSKKGRRRLYRLKNFKSFRMAQRHGDALGAHARGMPRLAISLLQQIAQDAPSAPQVYSSLGMVYHDMYQTAWHQKVQVKLDEWNLELNVELELESNNANHNDNEQTTTAATTTTETNNDNENEQQQPQKQQELEQQQQQQPPQDGDKNRNDETTTADTTTDNDNNDNTAAEETSIVPPLFMEALDLAQKAYGSYHVAAILCKKDYSLWVRAADTACDIANIYQHVILYHFQQQQQQHRLPTSSTSRRIMDKCRQEQERWYNEAKNDYQTADNLKPPGLDIPIKLASIYMELGHFSEALTLWTDLLLQQQQQQQQSSSTNNNTAANKNINNANNISPFRHTAWLLYAECMLHIGHECEQWNNGNNESSKNYMFRRWLRKWSTSFDWRERRLQALVLALEAAAGSQACQQLMEWMRQRDVTRKQVQQQLETEAKEKEEQERAAMAFAQELVDNNNDTDTMTIDDSTGAADPTSQPTGDGGDVQEQPAQDWDDNNDTDNMDIDDSTGAADPASAAAAATSQPTDDGGDVQQKAAQDWEDNNDAADAAVAATRKPTDDLGDVQQKAAPDLDDSNDGETLNVARSGVDAGDTSKPNIDSVDKDTPSVKAKTMDVITPDKRKDDSNEHASPEGEKASSNKQSLSDLAAQAEFESEKRLLLQHNQSELAAFDQTTENMKLVLGKDASREGGTDKVDALKERSLARRRLTKSHKAQVNKLEGEYKEKIEGSGDVGPHDSSGDNQELAAATHLEDRNIPLAASCGAVTKVASELMKHMIEMKIFKGGRLVGEAVSLYMKERARVYDKKCAARERFNRQSSPFGSLLGPLSTSYDEINDDGGSSSDDESVDAAYLSDEELFETPSEGPRLLDSLRLGILPTEISVLFALCLMHEGGRNYIAKKCLESIDFLQQESKSWVVASDAKFEIAKDLSWSLRHAIATEPLGRTVAYAFVADSLCGTAEEVEWAAHLTEMFTRLVEDLRKHGLIDAMFDPHNSHSEVSSFRRRQIFTSIHAWGRLQVIRAKEACVRAVRSSLPEEAKRAKESVIHTFKGLKKYLNICNSQGPVVGADGSMSKDFVQLLYILREGYVLLSEEDRNPCSLDESNLQELTSECGDIVSWLCLANVSTLDSNTQDSTIFDSTDWNALPLPSSWQSPQHMALSLRCYNLCVSFNVSHFSGWEAYEFSLRLMKSRASCTYFGLKINDGIVAGFLPVDIEEELGRQWLSLENFLPLAESFNFKKKLEEKKQLPWYKEGILKHNRIAAEETISVNAERQGLDILLAHSKSCLRLATMKESYERHQLLMTSLSIILPITQFCLDQIVWYSDIGKAATFDTGVEGWKNISRKRPTSSKKRIHRPSDRRRKIKEPARPLDEWFPGEDRSNPLSNAVTIPVGELQRLWLGDSALETRQASKTKEPTPEARLAMKKVHEAMQKLRACYTEAAVEKASLEIATALLNLVAVKDACENPFLCLQQAAIFASHGTKQGSSDDFFREKLPELSKCTPEEALVVLGRADCFQSVYFPYEAAFLCSFVARVCSVHRESSFAEDEDEIADVNNSERGTWNNKWMVVSILCYNVSTLIRSTASKVMIGTQQPRKEEFDPWDEDVIDELLLGRSDAIAWKSSLSKGQTFTVRQSSVQSLDAKTGDGGSDGRGDDESGTSGTGVLSAKV